MDEDAGHAGISSSETTSEKLNCNEGEAGFQKINVGRNSKHKHDIAHILDGTTSSSPSSQAPTKKKRRKERESVENLIVKENQSLSFLQVDHNKRKTKKMVDMADLERERNISLLNEICRSKSGIFRKKFKRNVKLPGRPSTCEGLTEQFDCRAVETKIRDNDSSSKQTSLQFQTGIKSCQNLESRLDDSESDTFSQKRVSDIFSTINDYQKQNNTISHGNRAIEYSFVPETCNSSSSLLKKEIEIENNKSPISEENEFSNIGLQISDLKGNAWTDPDDYTSDEAALVIDEDSDSFDTYFVDGGNRESRNLGNKPCLRGISVDLSEEEAFQEIEPMIKMNIEKNISKSDITSDTKVVVDSHSRDKCQIVSYKNNYSPIQIQQSSNDKRSMDAKNSNNYINSNGIYVETQPQDRNNKGLFLHSPSFMSEIPIEKIGSNNSNEKGDKDTCNEQSFSSLSLINMTGISTNKPSSKIRFIEGEIIDIGNNVAKTGDFKHELSLRDDKSKSDSQEMFADSPEHSLRTSNLDLVLSTKDNRESTTKHCSSSINQKSNESKEGEFNVLRKHLERTNYSHQKFGMSRDLTTSRLGTKRSEYFCCQVNNKNVSNENQTLEPLLFPPLINASQNTSIEFNKVIFCMYKELLTPHSQNLIRQLTEVLHLVINESVRYSHRCKKSKRLMSADLITREQILAHRDFQANTTFYGMYFTHLFRNVVQCFPATREFHNFMYLALFVNISRRLRSVFNINLSYVHIARKLIVSMLKANSYNDFTIFLAICKPDYVFETDYMLVSQLIDSFYEFSHSSLSMSYLFQGSRYTYDLQQIINSMFLSKNILHPEFPPVLKNVVPKSSSYSDPFGINLIKEDPFILGRRFPSKDINTTSSRDPRTFTHSCEPNKENFGKSRPFSLPSEHYNPVTLTPTSLLPSSPLIPVKPISYSTQRVSLSNPSSFHFSTSSELSRNRILSTAESHKMFTRRGFARNTGMTRATASQVPAMKLGPRPSSNAYLWRPTAVRPPLKPCSPFYPSPFFLNTLTIPPPTSGP